jgi:hypothetical protein
MTLQLFYDIKEEKRKRSKLNHPELSRLRPALFWDTSIEHIDWMKQKRSVIKRVFERGNLTEKKEILRFYGRNDIKEILMIEKNDNDR